MRQILHHNIGSRCQVMVRKPAAPNRSRTLAAMVVGVGVIAVTPLTAAIAASTCSNFSPLVVTVVSGSPCSFFTSITSPTNFEDYISSNDVIQFENNAPISDQIGIQVTPNGKTSPAPAGYVPDTTVTASQGNTLKSITFNPQPTIPNQFSSSIGNVNNAGPWTLTIANGTNVVTTVTPDLSGAVTLPFVKAPTMIGAGLTPTFTWTVPAGTPATVGHVTIFDHGQMTVAGYDARILDTNVPIAAGSACRGPIPAFIPSAIPKFRFVHSLMSVWG